MLDPKAFVPFPKAETGDESVETLYAAIGRVTIMWEACDFALGSLYLAFVSRRKSGPILLSDGILRAYGVIPSFSMREKLIEAAAEAYFHQPPSEKLTLLRANTKRILKLSIDASARRTEVVHGSTLQIWDRSGTFLGPSPFATKKRDIHSIGSYRLCSEQINELAKKIEQLRDEIFDLTEAVRDWRRSSRKREQA